MCVWLNHLPDFAEPRLLIGKKSSLAAYDDCPELPCAFTKRMDEQGRRQRNHLTSIGYWSNATDRQGQRYFELLNDPNTDTFPTFLKKNSKLRNLFGVAVVLSLEPLKDVRLGGDSNLAAIWAPGPKYVWSMRHRAS